MDGYTDAIFNCYISLTGHGSLRQNKPNGYFKKKYRDIWMVKLRYIWVSHQVRGIWSV